MSSLQADICSCMCMACTCSGLPRPVHNFNICEIPMFSQAVNAEKRICTGPSGNADAIRLDALLQ